MSDDIFSQLFNLFNNDDDDVNWKLVEQISNHINKDSEEVLMLSNSSLNYEEIFRTIELSPEAISTEINTVQVLNPKDYGNWIINSIKHYDYSNLSMENNSFNLGAAQSSLVAMQLGNIVGFISKNTWGLSHFGFLLPRSKTLSLNNKNFQNRISKFDIDENQLVLALMTCEFVALELGKYTAPFSYVINQMQLSNEALIDELKEASPNFDPTQITNPQDMFSNVPEINNLNFENIFDSMFAPLSFYRSIIKLRAKSILEFIDSSVVDLVMDLSFSSTENGLSEFESKLSKFDQQADEFITFLEDTKNIHTTDDILSDESLIPNQSELQDPLSWAARTSLPPI
jgi:hypothetical protein